MKESVITPQEIRQLWPVAFPRAKEYRHFHNLNYILNDHTIRIMAKKTIACSIKPPDNHSNFVVKVQIILTRAYEISPAKEKF